MRARLAVIGSINMDLVVTTPRTPLSGENLLAHDWRAVLGGKGANCAVALARMGADVRLMGCVGDDSFGAQAAQVLADEEIRREGIRVIAGARTGMALIMVDDQGENTILVIIGANALLDATAVEAALAPHWGSLEALVVNFEVPEPAVAAAVRAGRAHGLPVIVDAGPPRAFTAETWGAATVLSPNRAEAEALVGYPVGDDNTIRCAAYDLLRQGPKAVVLKLGARGAFFCTHHEERMVAGFDVPVVDTTGAGDAFTAALALMIAEDQSLSRSVRFACAAGAVAVTRLGAMAAMPTRAEAERLLW